jgi:hypothetical protein
MCRPGSDECKARDAVAAELRADGDTLVAALKGRPLYHVGENGPTTVTVLPLELFDLIVADARQQLANVTGTAVLAYQRMQNRTDLVAADVARWHHENPGLSRLLQLPRPETTEGS